MISDVRFAFRLLRKNLSLTIVAVLTLALGIGANTAIFGVVNAVLLRPLPYNEAGRLVTVHEVSPAGELESRWITRERYEEWKAGSRSLDQIAALIPVGFNVRIGTGTQRVQGARVSANFFSLLGIKPAFGRLFLKQDEQEGQAIAVLDYNFWRDSFGADPDIVRKTVKIDSQVYMVAGILPPGFDYFYHQDVWLPLHFTKEELAASGDRSLHLLALRRNGVTIEQAQAELSTISKRSEKSAANARNARLIPLQKEVVGDVRPALVVFQAAVGLVFLIVCVNMTNLLLAQSATRRREIALRLALGAGRWRLIRQFFIESAMLAAFGATLGIVLTLWTSNRLLSAASDYLPFTAINGGKLELFLFAATLAIAAGLIVGFIPAMQIYKGNFSAALKSSDRQSTSDGSSTKWRSVLVIAEIALSVVLLIGAGLMIKSFQKLQSVDPGFDPDSVLKLRIALPALDYPNEQKRMAYYAAAIDRLKALPGVQSVGMINWLPLSGISLRVSLDLPGRDPATEKPEVDCHVITPDYLSAMQIRLKRGRGFTQTDDQGASGAIVVSESFARRYSSRQDPVGETLKVVYKGEGFTGRIVGIVSDVRGAAMEALPQPEIYVSYSQIPWNGVALREFAIRTGSDPAALAEPARNALWSLDPNVPIYQVQTMTGVLHRSMGGRRFNRNLVTLFGLVALVLVIMGVYGLIAYSVNQRIREIGVRMALGAAQKDILRLIVKQGVTIAIVGICVGIAGAIFLTGAMSGLLFGVPAGDPATFAAISLLMAAVAAAASYIPARRASRVNPLIALRYE